MNSVPMPCAPRWLTACALLACAVLLMSAPATAATFDEYNSHLRCATPDAEDFAHLAALFPGDDPTSADCASNSTNPTADYDPDETWVVQVVVHILLPAQSPCEHNEGGTGHISDAMVQSQIDILNEDFQAIMGTNGANGNNAMIHFELATEDPLGNPAIGITRSCNNAWWGDGGGYFNSLAWDPNRYLNIYTNNTGALGYVSGFPNNNPAFVGSNSDRVVLAWDTVGRNAPFFPFDQGRTGTHEVGHYFGIYHTFQSGCGTQSSPGCYSSGDTICDTNGESSPFFGSTSGGMCTATAPSKCGTPDPIDNYMDYSDDLCMEQFTVEQVRRMRCTMQFWRPNIFTVGDTSSIFSDGFESGNTDSWSAAVP